jgi:hypothetical protein
VLKDLKTLEVNAWWKKAGDRDLWNEIIGEEGGGRLTRGCRAKEEDI